MKYFIAGALLVLVALGTPLTLEAEEPGYKFTIENQVLIGKRLQFDVLMHNTAATDIFLGECSFVLTFNEKYFGNPEVQVVVADAAQQQGYTAQGRMVTTHELDFLAKDHLVVDVGTPELAQIPATFDVMSQKLVMVPGDANPDDPGVLVARVTMTDVTQPEEYPTLSWESHPLLPTAISAAIIDDGEVLLELITPYGEFADADGEVTVQQETSVAEQAARTALKVYPNPAREQIAITLPEPQDRVQVVLSSLLGEQVLKQVVPVSDTKMSLTLPAALPAGRYTLQVSSLAAVPIGQAVVVVAPAAP